MSGNRALKKLREGMRGLSAERIALLLAVGLVLGTFPVFGLPTVFCLAAAFVLRVSLPALQLVNQLASPLQWLLLLPLQRVGWLILRPPAASTPVSLVLQAIAGWCLVCLPLGCVLYLSLLYLLRRRRPL